MRVTNQMVTSSSLRNMQKSMQKVSNLNEQATTGKKISAPSDDPVIAIRALKLRTTCDQLSQYKDKNIQDALSWLDTTQTSIQNIEDRLQDVYYYCTQGAQDTFQTDDRSTIINELYSLKDAIYKEGGTTYAGRYLFSGYKTETNLVFQNDAAKEGLSYNITQELSPDEIDTRNVVLNEVDISELDQYLSDSIIYTSPTSTSVHRLQLAYNNLESDHISLTVTDSTGNETRLTVVTKEASNPEEYYDIGSGAIHFIPETGELVFGDSIYTTIKEATSLTVNYNKDEFEVGDLRPEMYFNCTQYKEQADGSSVETQYTVSEKGQEIQYEVNFNQYLTVNAEGKDVIKHSMGNAIDEMAEAVQDVLDVEETIEKLKKLLTDPQYKDDVASVKQINKMLEDADVELALKKERMQTLFGNNMTNFQNFMDEVGAVQAKVGTNYSKLELIEVRVTEQVANFEELKSMNEDVETEEIAIDLYQAEIAYEAALSTTASVIQKTLLDYL